MWLTVNMSCEISTPRDGGFAGISYLWEKYSDYESDYSNRLREGSNYFSFCNPLFMRSYE